MNQNNPSEERENISEDYSVKKNRKGNAVALIVCVCLAFLLWLVIRNIEDNDKTERPDVPGTTVQSTEQLI